MPGRGVAVFAVVLLCATGGLWWRSSSGRVSESHRAMARTLTALARDSAAPIGILSENDEVDRAVHDASAPRVIVVSRTAAAIEGAVRDGTLLAGPRGREYLEVFGYELASLPEDAQSASLPLSRVEGRLRCAAVRGDAWSPLPGLEYTGRLGLVLAPAEGGAMMLVVGDDLPLAIDVASADGLPLRMSREVLPSITAAPPDYWIEGRSPLDAPGQIQQLRLDADGDRARLVSVRLGRRATRVLARLRNYPAGAHATVCAASSGAEAAFRDSTHFSLALSVDAYFGTGWGDPMHVPDVGDARWMGRSAALIVPSSRRGAVRVRLRAYRPDEQGDGDVALRINLAIDLPSLHLRPGLHEYEWTVPVNAWVAGTNEILLQVSGPGVERVLAVTSIELSLLP